MTTENTVLIVANDLEDWQKSIFELTDEHGYRVLRAQKLSDALSLSDEAHIDLVICEYRIGKTDGVALLRQFRVSHPHVIRILVKETMAKNDVHGAIEKAAIYQYIRKPLDHVQVGLVAKRALETRELARRHRLLSRELKFHENSPVLVDDAINPSIGQSQSFEKLIYVSEPMSVLCDLARLAAATDLPVLIQGETGTGKELFARAIHYNSTRAQSPLLVQNCGGISDELLQSELFGHKRGAFTGAISDRLGLFRAANGGTVFLDEISEVSASFQLSLLRFLQEGEVKPLGCDKTSTCDTRIIAASSRPLQRLVEKGEFRRDLYYRLKGFELTVPPLRARTPDIAVLAGHFAKSYGDSFDRRILGIANDVLEKFELYNFPGNVRELENEIRRMVAMASDGGYLTISHLSPEIAAIKVSNSQRLTADIGLPGDTLKEKVEALEKALVGQALKDNRWNQSEAARELGLSRVGLANKIKRYDIEPSV